MQTTLDKNKGYYDGFEACFDDYALFIKLDLKEELEQAVGHGLIAPLIIEEDSPCPTTCFVVQGIISDEECEHCSLISLTMGYAPPHERK